MNTFYPALLCLLFSSTLSAQSTISVDNQTSNGTNVKTEITTTTVVKSESTESNQTSVTGSNVQTTAPNVVVDPTKPTLKEATNNSKTVGQSNATQTKLSKTDFDNMPEQRKNYVLAHPELFKIEE